MKGPTEEHKKCPYSLELGIGIASKGELTMSCNYADGLSPYDNKGKLGLPESFDSEEEVDRKVRQLAAWIKSSEHTVFYTGAGISTSAGIPDFRGPKGVWTLEKKGLKPDVSVDWIDARPTKAHMAIKRLVDLNLAQFLISQNIDGLHMRSGLSRAHLAELHGNMFVDECPVCRRQFVRNCPAPTVGQKPVGRTCPTGGKGDDDHSKVDKDPLRHDLGRENRPGFQPFVTALPHIQTVELVLQIFFYCGTQT